MQKYKLEGMSRKALPDTRFEYFCPMSRVVRVVIGGRREQWRRFAQRITHHQVRGMSRDGAGLCMPATKKSLQRAFLGAIWKAWC